MLLTLQRGVVCAALILVAFLLLPAAPGKVAHAAPEVSAQGGAASDSVLSLNDGGQFVFWTFGSFDAAGVFATVKIAWLFDPAAVTWIAFIPALGTVNFPIADGDVLWIVSSGRQDIPLPSGDTENGGPPPIMLRVVRVADGFEPSLPVVWGPHSWSPDSESIAVVSNFEEVNILDFATLDMRRIFEGAVQEVAWSPDGDRIAVAGQSGVVVLSAGDAASQRLTSDPSFFLAWSSDGTMLAFENPSAGRLQVWDGAETRLFDGSLLQWLDDGRLAITRDAAVGDPGVPVIDDAEEFTENYPDGVPQVLLQLIDPADGSGTEVSWVVPGDRGSLTVSPDARFLAYALRTDPPPEKFFPDTSLSRLVRVRRLETGELVATFENARTFGGAFLPDGERLLLNLDFCGMEDGIGAVDGSLIRVADGLHLSTAVSADGTQVAFTDPTNIVVAPPMPAAPSVWSRAMCMAPHPSPGPPMAPGLPSRPSLAGSTPAFRRLPFALLPEEDMSPLVHAAAIADFVNPFANLSAGTRIGSIYSG